MSGYIGRDVSRVDGPAKVTGSARYSGEIALPGLAYAEIVGARVASGRITSIEQNRERLESLGTMAAGLAHELNNPAAAARRASSELADALEVLGSTIGMFVESGVERSEAEV